MKRILSILTLMLSLVACSQNQTFTGVKTFTSPPKFKALIQNDLNTKVLTINPTDVLQWRDASTFGISDAPVDGSNYVRNNASWVQIPAPSVPSLADVLYSGNTAPLNIIRSYSTGGPGNQTTYSTTLDPNFLEVKAFYQGTSSEDKTEYGMGYIKQNSFTYNFPANSGTLAVINSTGTANMGFGEEALDATPSTGSYNLAVGIAAATALTGGSQNVAIGNYAMYASTTSSGNTAVGTSALQNHTTGNYNTAVGFHALESRIGNLTGSANIGLGLQAGRAVTTGSNNILIENTTNDGISTGSFNIILDGRNKSGVTTGSGNVIIGGYDGVFPATMAETIVIGTGTGTQRFKIDSTGKAFVLGAINVGAVPTYADNTTALAGGLVAGDVYKTSVGVLMITF